MNILSKMLLSRKRWVDQHGVHILVHHRTSLTSEFGRTNRFSSLLLIKWKMYYVNVQYAKPHRTFNLYSVTGRWGLCGLGSGLYTQCEQPSSRGICRNQKGLVSCGMDLFVDSPNRPPHCHRLLHGSPSDPEKKEEWRCLIAHCYTVIFCLVFLFGQTYPKICSTKMICLLE